MKAVKFKEFTNPIFIIIALAIMQFIIAVFTHSLSFTQEESMWQYIGRNWISNGQAPYAGGVDNKSPLIFYIFGISDWLFGNNIWFPRLLGTIVQSVSVWYLYKVVLLLKGKTTATFSILIYGLSLTWLGTGGRYVSFTETYCVAFLIPSFYYTLKKQGAKSYIISGLLAAAAICFRLTGVFGVMAMGILIIKNDYKKLPSFFLGLILFLLLFLLFLFVSGIKIDDFAFYSFTDNFGPGSVTDRPVSAKWSLFKDLFIWSPLLLFYPFVLYFIFKIKNNRFLLIWLSLEFAGIIVIGDFARNHLKHILPVLSIIAGISITNFADFYKFSVKWVYAAVIAAFFPKTLEPLYGIKNSLYPIAEKSAELCTTPYKQPDPYQLKLLGLWLKDNSKPSDKILIAGTGSQVHAYAERQSPSIYFKATYTNAAKKRFFQDVIVNQPEMILIPKFPEYEKYTDEELRNFIKKIFEGNYIPVGCRFGYEVYVKNI